MVTGLVDYTVVKMVVVRVVPKVITGIKYRDGVMRNGLCVMTYNLADAHEGAGGFACIPGSHKSNFLREIPGDVRNFERATHYVGSTATWCG